MVFFVSAAVVLMLGIHNYTTQFSSAGDIADDYHTYHVEASSTDLRLGMGLQLIGQLLLVGGLAVVGWSLYGSETEQYGYLIVSGLLLIGMTVIRVTPVLPLSVARHSTAALLYGTRVRVQAVADQTPLWLTMPLSDFYRVAVAAPGSPEGLPNVLLDFGGDVALRDAYLRSRAPVTLLGSAAGTRTVVKARGREIKMLPRVRVIQLEAPASPSTGGT